MQIKKVLGIGLRILAVCLLFAVCMAAGDKFSGLERAAQQGPAGQTSVSSPQTLPAPPISPHPESTPPPAPSDVLVSFLTFSVCVGIVMSYLILRSSWDGWTLAGALAVGMYGISTVVIQIESIYFLSNKLPPGLIAALFVQSAIATVLFTPQAVLVLGKWRAAPPSGSTPPAHLRAASVAWKLPLLVVAFVFLYMFFGYYVAWQNPDVRQYYSGPNWPTFFDSLKGNWLNARRIYAVATFRALLYIGFVFPLIRMLRVARWESAAATALFLSVWTTILLMPNPLMPASVAHSHFWETLGFNLTFGSLLGWLFSTPPAAVNNSNPAAP